LVPGQSAPRSQVCAPHRMCVGSALALDAVHAKIEGSPGNKRGCIVGFRRMRRKCVAASCANCYSHDVAARFFGLRLTMDCGRCEGRGCLSAVLSTMPVKRSRMKIALAGALRALAWVDH